MLLKKEAAISILSLGKSMSSPPFEFARRERRIMEIERLNESTIKFFITYKDIENRGLIEKKFGIIGNAVRNFSLKWINEANDKEDFELEGLLWIQVQALDGV
ncbi:adaptor protein MecA [Anaerobacillus sp. HL2]|nr:adaptor protein MecA [Anaerobacillus sp. HL2]